MKAVIFNSGLGKRMEEFTKYNHKAMLKLLNGETIFERQIRILSECGIEDFIITVGYLKEQLINLSKSERFSNLNFTFVENKDYESTNYIYSMYLADKYLDSDVLLLHGDLVFNKNLIIDILENKNASLCLYNETKDLPEKDFKGRIQDGFLKEVSINIFDDDCYAFQPLYKLSKDIIVSWKNEVKNFIEKGINQVYAENALNKKLDKLMIKAFSYEDNYIEEIDNPEDYNRVSKEISHYDYREQEIYLDGTVEQNLDVILKKNNIKRIFLVGSDNHSNYIKKYLQDRKYDFISFKNFTSNPRYEEIKEGINLFVKEKCDFIISVGGGSTIDVAKCIKLLSKLDSELLFLEERYNYSSVKHLAIPTTSGTGSESTRFAVMYYNDIKQSITHDSILPEYAILEPEFLATLPEYFKKSTMLDSLCQAIESYWSKKATDESKIYSKTAIKIINENYITYLSNDERALKKMLIASNFSGKAINITTTTAPHAMSYKLTSLYGISHGHAVGLCLPMVWKYIYDNLDSYPNRAYLEKTFLELADILGTNTIDKAIEKIEFIYNKMDFSTPDMNNEKDLDILVKSINIERLKNNPVVFNNKDLKTLYINIIQNLSEIQ